MGRKFTNWVENSNIWSKIQNCGRKFKTLLENSQIGSKIQNCGRKFKNLVENSKIWSKIQNFAQKFTNCGRKFKNLVENSNLWSKSQKFRYAQNTYYTDYYLAREQYFVYYLVDNYLTTFDNYRFGRQISDHTHRPKYHYLFVDQTHALSRAKMAQDRLQLNPPPFLNPGQTVVKIMLFSL